MKADLESLLRTEWRSCEVAPSFDLAPVPPMLSDGLPADYLAVVSEFGGREGFLGAAYLRLYRLGELATLNFAYEVPSRLPEIIVFGSNGYGEAFAFILETGAVVRVPFIPLVHECAEQVAPSFTALVSDFARTGTSLAPNPEAIGMEVHAKQPICLGGSPTDPSNRVFVPPVKHAEICRFWNKVYQDAVKRS